MTESRPASAMQLAQRALDKWESHESECARRYRAIEKSIGTVLAILTWGGVTAFTLIMAMLGWSLNQQFQANAQARAEATAKIETLQRQLDQRQDPPSVTVVK